MMQTGTVPWTRTSRGWQMRLWPRATPCTEHSELGNTGAYRFPSVAPGAYELVELAPPPGYLLNSDPVGLVMYANVTLEGIGIPDYLAGNTDADPTRTPSPTPTATPTTTIPGSISGTVWYDQDGDRQMEFGEPGLVSVTLRLVFGSTQVGLTATQGDGTYRFSGLLPGRGYQVQEVHPHWVRYSSTPDTVSLPLENGQQATGRLRRLGRSPHIPALGAKVRCGPRRGESDAWVRRGPSSRLGGQMVQEKRDRTATTAIVAGAIALLLGLSLGGMAGGIGGYLIGRVHRARQQLTGESRPVSGRTPMVPFSLSPSNGEGALVREVLDGSPAADAGIKPGDLITQLDGSPVNTSHPLSEVLASYQPGDVVSVRVVRAERTVTVDVTLTSSTTNRAQAYLGIRYSMIESRR